MKKLLILSGLIFIANISLFAQLKVKSQPESKVLYIDGSWRQKDNRNLRYWYVVSDRRDNQAYRDQNCVIPVPKFTLNFGETVYVLDYEDNKLLITRPVHVNAAKVFIGNEDEKGWIHEDNLVLTNFCYRTKRNPLLPNVDNGLYTRKVFIFNQPGTYTKPEYYSHPNDTGNEIDKFDIYTIFYVFKEDGDRLLLGRKPEKNMLVDDNLVGWIDKINTASWNHNMCMEKNWYEEAVSERINMNIPVRIANNNIDARRILHGGKLYNQPLLYQENEDNRFGFQPIRLNGDMFRSPIINTITKDTLFEVGYLTRGIENDQLNSDERDRYLACLSDVLTQLNTINIVFLIDGTHSILPYKQTIINNLRDAMNHLSSMVTGATGDSQIRLRYNAFIYRDDPYTPRFSIRSNYKKMTTNTSEILNFIDKELVEPSPVKDDLPESMFWGFKIISDGLEEEIKPFEKTFVIVIGDAGDHQRDGSQTYLGPNEVINLLLPKTYSVSAIQVRHKSPENISSSDPRDKETYNQFQRQFRDLLINYYRQKYNVGIPESSVENIGKDKPISRFPHSDLNIPSMLIYPADNDTLSHEALGEQLRNLIINAPMADFRVEMPCNIPPSVLTILDFPPTDPDFGSKALYALMNFYYVKGFIPQYSKDSITRSNNHRLFNDVQYFKTDELNAIDEQLRILIPDNNTPSSEPPKERLRNAWKEILVNRMKMVDEAEFPNITLQEAALFLTQNKGREEWAKIRMRDLTIESVFSNEMLGKYIFDWFTAKIMVQSILGNQSWFNHRNLDLHSDALQFCHEQLTGESWSKLMGKEKEVKKEELIERIMHHYDSLNYTLDSYIQNIARCEGSIFTSEVGNDGTLVKGDSFNVFWVSGEYFPYDNNYASEIFSN
jgi:hypothetical protein